MEKTIQCDTVKNYRDYEVPEIAVELCDGSDIVLNSLETIPWDGVKPASDEPLW